jgi:hypothetical protein
LPVDAQLGVDALLRLQVIVTDPNEGIRIRAVDAGEAFIVLTQVRFFIARRYATFSAQLSSIVQLP